MAIQDLFPCSPSIIDLYTSNEDPVGRKIEASISQGTNCVSSLDHYRISPLGHLHIIDIKGSDAGKYQCSAQNPLTGQRVNNSQVTILHVLNKPSNHRERPPLTTVYKPPVASR